MTISEFCLVAAGILVEAFTFGLGILVGASLREKAFQKNKEYETSQDWHTPRVHK